MLRTRRRRSALARGERLRRGFGCWGGSRGATGPEGHLFSILDAALKRRSSTFRSCRGAQGPLFHIRSYGRAQALLFCISVAHISNSPLLALRTREKWGTRPRARAPPPHRSLSDIIDP